jgi:hypothetical protein
MGRNIITRNMITALTAAGSPVPPQQPDNYAAQIVKLIPVEVVGVYLGISNLIDVQKISDPYLTSIQTIVFLLLLIITPFYLIRAAGVTDKTQIVVSTVSFFVWAISLGGPFQALLLKLHVPAEIPVKFLGGILIMIYTLIVPMFYRPQP